MIKNYVLNRWASNGKGVWILLFSFRPPVTKDSEKREERLWGICSMAFSFHISHGQDLHGFFISLVLN